MTQDLAIEILLNGKSAFLTGAAGAGKTYTLAKFIELSRKTGKKVAVTATTGLAATHLGGNTIHSWSGMGIRDEIDDYFFAKFGKTRARQIRETDILIIDEISMLHDFQLDLVEEILRRIRTTGDDMTPQKLRENDKPFGGIQVVFSGDFFQLPPVKSRNKIIAGSTRKPWTNSQNSEQNFDGIDETFDENGASNFAKKPNENPKSSFVYNAKSWAELAPEILYLEQNFRQNDGEFLSILNKIRENKITRADAEKIANRLNAQIGESKEITELYTTNRDVDRINFAKMAELQADSCEYEMTTTGSATNVEKLKKSCLAPEKLELKIGALVMALKNDPNGKFANGSIGKVVKFDDENDDPIVKFNHSAAEIKVEPSSWELTDGDKKLATLTQIPLRPAYAITVHKSQGMTLDAARINLKNVFEPGMGYVALSRVRGLDSLSISGLSSQAFFVHPEVLAMDEIFREKSAAAEQTFAKLLKNKEKREKEFAKLAAENDAKKSRSEKIREKFPNAGKRWTQENDDEIADLDLKKFTKNDESAEEILGKMSDDLGRSKSSVAARIFAKNPKMNLKNIAKTHEKYSRTFYRNAPKK